MKNSNGKKYREKASLVDRNKRYRVEEAMQLVTKLHYVKFDEAVEVSVRLGVDPKHADQMVRGSVSMPNGTGKKVKVIAFARGEKAQDAQGAGAEIVGADDLVEKIQGGFLDFDVAVATPDMMATVSKVAKILGPKGLMPNPKSGTVTMDVAKAIKEIKAGKVEYRVDKAGIVHAPIGRMSFGAEKLKDNFMALMEAIQKAKPASAKGKYLRNIVVSGTMTPGVKLDLNEFEQAAA